MFTEHLLYARRSCFGAILTISEEMEGWGGHNGLKVLRPSRGGVGSNSGLWLQGKVVLALPAPVMSPACQKP